LLQSHDRAILFDAKQNVIIDVVPVQIVSATTVPARVRLEGPPRPTDPRRGPSVGGDGRVRGWMGSVTVETSAMGVWLLEVAAELGLGGRVAYGFGRVSVTVEGGPR
jgi:CRISPR/Cas system endoribonuclease Cas6 (RAMP superfamily)